MNERYNEMLNERLTRSFDVTIVPIGGETFLVRRSEAFKVNKVGLFIWNALEGEKTLDEIVTAVSDKYRVDAQTASDHVQQFAADLKSQYLVGPS